MSAYCWALVIVLVLGVFASCENEGAIVSTLPESIEEDTLPALQTRSNKTDELFIRQIQEEIEGDR